MQSFEKALHMPMPFATGGQTITDRLTAARHALAGSQLGKTICKATTEELVAPKKKHLDYLLHCTNEPNVSIPSMANLLIERTQNPNWIVVYKALITIHNIMCYGNERFSQYLASCNTTFNLTNFLDKSNPQGYDMSQHVRRYGKYISEKIFSYRTVAFDFCKIKRGGDTGMLRTLNTDKLIKTLPTLQTQMDALLEFQVTSGELTNGVINCSFILLFRDLIRLFACYNDGVINLLEKFFDMNKKQARDAFELYKSFLLRLDKVAAFLSVADSVGIDRTEVPDLTRAPSSLIEALETHLHHLEGGRGPPPSASQQIVTQQLQQSAQPVNTFANMSANIDPASRQRYIEEEKERLRQYEEQRQKQLQQNPQQNVFNPFEGQQPAAAAPAAQGMPPTSMPQYQQPPPHSQPPQTQSSDMPLMGVAPSAPQQQQQPTASHGAQMPHDDLFALYQQPQHQAPPVDPTNPFANPFASSYMPPQQHPQYMPPQQQQQAYYGGYPPQSQANQQFGFTQPPPTPASTYSTGAMRGPPTTSMNGFKDYPQPQHHALPPQHHFAPQHPGMAPQAAPVNPFLVGGAAVPPPHPPPPNYGMPPQQMPSVQHPSNPFDMAPAVSGAPHQPPAMPPQSENPYFTQSPPTDPAAAPPVPYCQAPPTSASQPVSVPHQQSQQSLGIYEQTPFAGNDSSYTAPSNFQQQMQQSPSPQAPSQAPTESPRPPSGGPPRPPPPSVAPTPAPAQPPAQDPGTFDPFTGAPGSQAQKPDIDSTLSNLVNNMEIAGKNPAWMQAPTTTAPTTSAYGAAWPQQQPPPGYGGYQQPSMAAANNPFAVSAPNPYAQAPPQPSNDPFSGFQ